MSYVIRFDFPEMDYPVFAGKAGGTLGFAPTLATALRFPDSASAERMLANGYETLAPGFGAVVSDEGVGA